MATNNQTREKGKGGGGMENKISLNEIKTCELVAELEKREGVEKIFAEPYHEKNISVEGPAVVLIVTD